MLRRQAFAAGFEGRSSIWQCPIALIIMIDLDEAGFWYATMPYSIYAISGFSMAV
ncbi:MAG: hypothetical protein PHQ35_07830 [Phycisphaerae bacterium]|nr:hypothetical protein [Phycisphaerae bacterium]MDD5380071.1 hypothetical protein [Phycisphaerae bacterium]